MYNLRKAFTTPKLDMLFASGIREWESAAKAIFWFTIGQRGKTTFLKVVAI